MWYFPASVCLLLENRFQNIAACITAGIKIRNELSFRAICLPIKSFNLCKPVTYTNLPHSQSQPLRAPARSSDKPGKLHEWHTSSCHANLGTSCLLQLYYAVFNITGNVKDSALTGHNIQFHSNPLILYYVKRIGPNTEPCGTPYLTLVFKFTWIN